MSTLTKFVWATSALLFSSAHALEALPKKPPVPADNPMSSAKVELGQMLFMDPRLSVDGTVSCNSCHDVMRYGTDNRSVSVGVAGQKGGRSAPTVVNAAYLTAQFWDGRAATLEDQAKGPILNPIEMGMPNDHTVVERLRKIPGYVERFTNVFGAKDPISYDNVAKAIAAYERTLVTPNAPFDKYMRGDKKAMSSEAKRGMKLVQDLGCTSCHAGANFAGPTNLKIGEGFYQKFPVFPDNEFVAKYKFTEDLGRYNVTKHDGDKNLWRVPTWRNIAMNAPYFHNGSVATLDEAVRVMAKTQLNKDLAEKQVSDIVAFLNSLTGSLPKQTMPVLPASANESLVDIR